MTVFPVPKPVKTKKQKVKKPLSKTQLLKNEKAQIRKLSKELKSICSVICRHRWGEKCAMCGREGTAAHHFFGWKACSSLRYSVNNLIWLCYGCHIGKVHQQGLTEPARKKLIAKIGLANFEDMYAMAFERKDWTLDELMVAKDNLLVLKEWTTNPLIGKVRRSVLSAYSKGGHGA